MKMRWLPLVITAWLVLLSASGAQASSSFSPGAAGIQANSSTFTYQGFLSLNATPAQGFFDLSFTLFGVASGGSALAGPIQFDNVSVNQGLFTVQLDFGPDVFNGDPRYLSIGVRPGASGGGYTTLSPRQPVSAAPYAIYAQNIPLDGTGLSTRAARSDHDHLGKYWVGDTSVGLAVESTTSSGTGLYGIANTGTNAWGVGGSSITGVGVIGFSSEARGVEGSSIDEIGVAGFSTNLFGVQGVTRSSNGVAVIGFGNQGRGIEGQSSTSVGVIGFSTDGRGVEGQSANDIGVAGFSTNYIGVYGRTDNVNSYAGYFTGRVYVNGTLSALNKQFKIDHPLDPANKYLQHSSVESSDMKNIYDGVVTLGANGSAVVQLPDWFEALNKDFRYQLTAIGAPGPNLYIAQEISKGHFTIAGGKAGMKVSWQVTGIRHDPYAEQNRTRPEVLKPANERGTYLYPQGYGQPATSGVDNQPEQLPQPSQALPSKQRER